MNCKNRKPLWEIVTKQYRLLLLYAYFVVANVLFLITLFGATANQDEWITNTKHLIKCVNQTWAFGYDDVSCCYDEYSPISSSRSSDAVLYVLYAGFGFYTCVILVTRKEVLYWFRDYYRHVKKSKSLFPPRSRIRSTRLEDIQSRTFSDEFGPSSGELSSHPE